MFLKDFSGSKIFFLDFVLKLKNETSSIAGDYPGIFNKIFVIHRFYYIYRLGKFSYQITLSLKKSICIFFKLLYQTKAKIRAMEIICLRQRLTQLNLWFPGGF